MASPHPSQIGAFSILALLGVGGMGKVYLARDSQGKQVALKVLLPELTAATLDRLRFEREFDIASQMDHPGLVSVYERSFENDLCYYSMEFVQGVDLGRRFQAGPNQSYSRQVGQEALSYFNAARNCWTMPISKSSPSPSCVPLFRYFHASAASGTASSSWNASLRCVQAAVANRP